MRTLIDPVRLRGPARRQLRPAKALALTAALLAAPLSVMTAQPAGAASVVPGLDPGFAGGGVLLDGDTPGSYDAVAVQPDGKIVVAGHVSVNSQMDLQLERYTASGALDPSFGSGGRVRSDFGQNEYAARVTVQADGAIVVAGVRTTDLTNPRNTPGIVARYTAGGVLDPSFGTGGWAPATGRPAALAVQPDGRIIVASNQFDPIIRLNRDGSRDGTFVAVNGNSVSPPAPTWIDAIGVTPDGHVVGAGSAADTGYPDHGGVAFRLTATGAPDPAYGDGGVARTPMGGGAAAEGALVEPDGTVLLAGQAVISEYGPRLVVDRVTAAGHSDPEFGLGGESISIVTGATYLSASQLAPSADGGVFVSGWVNTSPAGVVPTRVFVTHLRQDGGLDPRFGSAGSVLDLIGAQPNSFVTDLAVAASGAPLVTGSSYGPSTNTDRGFLARFLPPVGNAPVAGWGWNGSGQVGGTPGADLNPVIGLRARTDAAALAAGAYFNLALGADGSVWAWGSNAYGQLGDGTTTDRSSPVRVAGLSGVVAISAGAYHGLAVEADGSVWTWGWNGFGQLGDGTPVERHTPVRVTGLGDAVAVKVAGGAFHSLVLLDDGTVRAWGWNGFGQLGDGTTQERDAPVQVADLTAVVAVASGAYHGLALLADGSVQTWGMNAFGQLGDGTTVERHHAGAVPFLSGVTALAEGSWFHSLVLKDDGSAWAWGWNGYGQLGDGTTVERDLPAQVAPVGQLLAVAGGAFHSLAVDSSGSVVAWGSNVLGQLGDGTTVDRPWPVAVRSPSGVPAAVVAAGAYHSLAG